LLWNGNRKSQASDKSVPVPMTLNDLEKAGPDKPISPLHFMHSYVNLVGDRGYQ